LVKSGDRSTRVTNGVCPVGAAEGLEVVGDFVGCADAVDGDRVGLEIVGDVVGVKVVVGDNVGLEVVGEAVGLEADGDRVAADDVGEVVGD